MSERPDLPKRNEGADDTSQNEQQEKPTKRKRWWRYSLRKFLLLVTVFAVWLGMLVHRVNKQKQAVQWVEEHGGRVVYDFQWNDEYFPPLNFDAEPPGPGWLRELIDVEYFAEVIMVSLTDTQVSDLGPLRELTHLQALGLERTPVSDLEPLSELRELKCLLLNGTKVSDLGPLVGMNDVRIELDDAQQVAIPHELQDQVNRWLPASE